MGKKAGVGLSAQVEEASANATDVDWVTDFYRASFEGLKGFFPLEIEVATSLIRKGEAVVVTIDKRTVEDGG